MQAGRPVGGPAGGPAGGPVTARRLPRPPLLVVSDRGQARAPLETVAEAVFRAGVRWFLLREKDLAPAARRDLLLRLVALAQPYGARVSVSGDLAAARAAGTGVHLPAGGDVATARRALGPDALIGLSAHDEAELAAAAGADYATLSPVFESASKPGYGPALGLARLAALVAASPRPAIALGGVTAGRAAACLAAGAAGVAVMGEIMRAPDPAAAAVEVLSALEG